MPRYIRTIPDRFPSAALPVTLNVAVVSALAPELFGRWYESDVISGPYGLMLSAAAGLALPLIPLITWCGLLATVALRARAAVVLFFLGWLVMALATDWSHRALSPPIIGDVSWPIRLREAGVMAAILAAITTVPCLLLWLFVRLAWVVPARATDDECWSCRRKRTRTEPGEACRNCAASAQAPSPYLASLCGSRRATLVGWTLFSILLVVMVGAGSLRSWQGRPEAAFLRAYGGTLELQARMFRVQSPIGVTTEIGSGVGAAQPLRSTPEAQLVLVLSQGVNPGEPAAQLYVAFRSTPDGWYQPFAPSNPLIRSDLTASQRRSLLTGDMNAIVRKFDQAALQHRPRAAIILNATRTQNLIGSSGSAEPELGASEVIIDLSPILGP